MNDLNEVLLEGRLVRDPQGKRLESGALVCTFKIASNNRYVNKKSGKTIESAVFMLVEAWQNAADSCLRYLKKGDAVRVTGKIKQSKWESENHVSMVRTFISADHVEFKTRALRPETNETVEVTQQVKSIEEEPDEKEQEQINEEIAKQEEDD